MTQNRRQGTIEKAYEEREQWKNHPAHELKELREAVSETLQLLDEGELRIATPDKDAPNGWLIHGWLKKAILLSFMLAENRIIGGGGGIATCYDKVPLKFDTWSEEQWKQSGIRAVPGAVVRHSAYVAPRVILMPSFVNMGAYVGEGSMVDSWSTVGSCAQIGAHCHLSGGVGIGGVLEPLQASPVIIEDGCFIGARSEVAEGVRIGRGAVLAMGVFISASTKIVDRESGEVSYGFVPPYSVVVPGTYPAKESHKPSLDAVVIVKKVDAQTRAKTAINDLLRDD